MKKIFAILSVFAAVIGCQKPEMEQPQENEVARVPLKITADIAQTKTTMTNEGGVLKSAWKDGDELYVRLLFGSNFVESVKYTASVSGNSVEFITDSEGMAIPDAAYTNAQYRFVAEHPELGYSYSNRYANWRQVVVPDVQEQSAPGNLDHIAKTNVLYALPVRPTMVKDQPISLNFEMIHPLSVLQLNLKGSEEGIKIKNIKVQMLDETGTDFLSISSCQFNQTDGTMQSVKGTNQIQLNLASAAELPIDGYAQFYMTVSPGHAGQTFKVIATTDMGETIEVGSMKVPAENPIPTGFNAVKSFTVNPPAVVEPPVQEEIDYGSAIDLSANGTANTYIVNAPNTVYKFNAQVMGNGTVPTKMAEVVTSTVIAPKTALSLWYTCKQTSTAWVDAAPVEVSSIILKDDGYIYFKTPETFVNGNMVIAAFAEEGLTYSNITVNENREFTNATILWSWDIWAVEGYNPDASKITVGEQYLMDRNLGALVALSDSDAANNLTNGVWVANGQGNYYEFGRKDPFPSFAEYPANEPLKWGEKLLTTPAYTLITSLQMNGIGTSKSLNNQMFGTNDASCTPLTTTINYTDVELLGYVNGNPHKDINGSTTPYNWQSNGLGNYWKDMWGGESASDPSYKTIYDPCPAGWKLWDYNTMENFSIANEAAAITLTDDKQTCFGVNIAGSMFPFNGGGRDYSLTLRTFGSLINCNAGTTVPIALYTSAPYYYHSNMNKYYSGTYAAVTDWSVTTTAEGLVLTMSSVDEDNNDREYAKTASSYTSRAIPVRCIKE